MYHLNLELSFLLDENAYLPRSTSPYPQINDGRNPIGSGNKPSDDCTNENKVLESNSSSPQEKPTNSSNCKADYQPIGRDESNAIGQIKNCSVDKLSCPLLIVSDGNAEAVNCSNNDKTSPNDLELREERFLKCISGEVILSVSPLVRFSLPYLETKEGRSSDLRAFFTKDDLYWSEELGGVADGYGDGKSDGFEKNSNGNREQKYLCSGNRECVVASDRASRHPFTFQSLHASAIKPLLVQVNYVHCVAVGILNHYHLHSSTRTSWLTFVPGVATPYPGWTPSLP